MDSQNFTGEEIDVERIRIRIRAMTDAQLLAYGRAAAWLAGQPDCRETFRVQLNEARTEWRRRHPVTPSAAAS